MSAPNSVSTGSQTVWTLSPTDIIENCPTPSTVTLPLSSSAPRKLQTVLINRYAMDSYESSRSSGDVEQLCTNTPFLDYHSTSPKTQSNFTSGFSQALETGGKRASSFDYSVDSMMSPCSNSMMSPCSNSMMSPCSTTSSVDAVSSSTHTLDIADQPKLKSPKLQANKERLQEHCQICGDVASGFHCGAFVCEACKKFYVRASKVTNRSYVCSNRSNTDRAESCHIDKSNRTSCSYCRYQKCLSVGMEIPGKGLLDTHSLKSLPCKVCGSPSSGYHFGVLTCEGCKGFFRRLLQDGNSKATSLVCQADNKCEIGIQSRSQCRACRYSKCLSVGMSRNGARIGRQPNSVRYARIVENRPPKVEVIDPETDIDSKSGLSNDTTFHEQTPVSGLLQSNSFTGAPSTKLVPHQLPSSGDGLEHPMDLSVNDSMPLDLSPQVQSPYTSERYIERFAALFESSRLEYYKFVTDEGMMEPEVDDNKFAQLNYGKFQIALRLFVRYSKKLDGFMQLEIDDRVVLTKCAIYRFTLLVVSQRYDLKTGRHYMFGLKSWSGAPARLVAMYPDYKVLPYHFDDLARRIKQTACSREELGLLAILNIINADNLGDLKNPDAVRRLLNNYTELLTLITKDHPNPAGRMQELNHVLDLCRHAAQEHALAAKNVITKNPNVAAVAAQDTEIIPQLYKEMFSHTPWEHWKSE